MTPDQLRLIVALAEPVLRGDGRASTSLPSNQDVARRLGWRLTRVNRKLDNVCQKLAAQGIRGLHGAPGRLASNRRARLVEYAIAVRMVSRDDLALLESSRVARSMAEPEIAGYHSFVRIGSGGLGDVFRAVDRSTGATVAIKVLRDVSDSSVAWHRTRRELTALDDTERPPERDPARSSCSSSPTARRW